MAQQTPPPYIDIDGLYVQIDKHVDATYAQYDGKARPGQLVVDTANYAVYVGNSAGTLNYVGGGGSGPGGATTWATLGDKTNASGPVQIALGQNAGISQGVSAIAIGKTAGNTAQSANAIAIGTNAGSSGQGINTVAIGLLAGQTSQTGGAIGIGQSAGQTSQGSGSIAVGSLAGVTTQGAQGIAIGGQAGQTNQGANAIAIGRYSGQTNQATSSIVINASGVPLNNIVPSSFVVQPVRGLSTAAISTAGGVPVFYIPSTGEFVYNNGT